MAELKGSLGGIGLPAIAQLIGDLHHSGTLELTRGDAVGVLGFDDGRLVLVTFGQQQGLDALAACTVGLADAEFRFVEGVAAGDRTLDLGPAELQRQLARIASGEDLTATPPPVPSATEPDGREPSVCPRLGFADDVTRHYSRPTALHRCFAGQAPSLVTNQEQRELCLGGGYPTCPRFRDASRVSSAPKRGPVDSAPTAPAPPAPTAPAPPDRPLSPTMPAGVAARMASVAQMRLTSSGEEAPNGVGPRRREVPVAPARSESAAEDPGPRLSRGLLLIVGGALVGVIVLVAVLVFLLPTLNRGVAQPAPVPAAAGVVTPPITLPTPVRAPTLAPTLAPTPVAEVAGVVAQGAPSPTPAPRLPTPAPNAESTATPAGQSLIDVRLAAGPAANWIDNPPYATWSDGAYRLRAQQPGQFVAVGVPVDQTLTDMVVSATFRKTGGPPGGGYGLIVRDQGPGPADGVNQTLNAYVLEAGDSGEFGVWRRDGDHWVDLVPWTQSTSVRMGGSPNDLVVRAIGAQLTFSINGAQVASVQDGTLSTGTVGLFVGGDDNEVALDHFAVQVLPPN